MLRLEGASEPSEQRTVEHERQDGLRLGGRPFESAEEQQEEDQRPSQHRGSDSLKAFGRRPCHWCRLNRSVWLHCHSLVDTPPSSKRFNAFIGMRELQDLSYKKLADVMEVPIGTLSRPPRPRYTRRRTLHLFDVGHVVLEEDKGGRSDSRHEHDFSNRLPARQRLECHSNIGERKHMIGDNLHLVAREEVKQTRDCVREVFGPQRWKIESDDRLISVDQLLNLLRRQRVMDIPCSIDHH